ncbi:hypothetical protein Rhopal_000395-T1 [Rhodotorula paludigena]|uniref:Uncharacterized protein n=1 Tax=Rhodotorula paludigena TaxID=86838 RepID=A0AAV5GCU8_9BASI|nr:hypothetical protein Rhopal_000395-T1 [Rhodotorula paludigena]
MLALRPTVRLVASSSSAQFPIARALSHSALASAIGESAPRTPAAGSHEAQARPRQRTLRQVGEESGSTAQLVALAVKNTRSNVDKEEQNRYERTSEHRANLQRRLEERKAAAARGQVEGSSGPREGGERRRPTAPRGDGAQSRLFQRRAPSEGAGSRPRRFDRRSPSSPSSSASASGSSSSAPFGGRPRNPSAPRQPRRAPRAASRGQEWAAEHVKPLVPPSSVRYPSANLAQLLRADLASKAVQLKSELGPSLANEDAESREDREKAKRVLGGDYSLWLEEAGQAKAKGKDGVVAHAHGILKANPSVHLSKRQVLLDKIREAVL